MSVVAGKDIMCYMKVGVDYYPIFCGKSATLQVTQDEIETTNVNSGSSREYEVGMASSVFQVTGVTILDNSDNKVSVAYLMQQSVRRQKKSWKVVMTDVDGNDLVMTFDGFITETGFDKNIGAFSQSNVTVRISGGITYDNVLPPVVEEVYSDWWTMEEGSTSITGESDVNGYELINCTVLEVNREGVNYDLVTGSPSGRQAKHNSTTGEISFDTNIPSNGETVFVLFKEA